MGWILLAEDEKGFVVAVLLDLAVRGEVFARWAVLDEVVFL